ncbi:ATP-NAD kinase family protein [Ruminococcaceae bacterium OttesenSCG-928-I18]|nr:ATP-NAD kinase family protein [Ruminococcaceae bacterium OttesenSCG-928-I18]
MKKIGFILNPVAGMGGRVGLKGSDGADTIERARALGAKPESAAKAKRALQVLAQRKDGLLVLCPPGGMGEDAARACGLHVQVLGEAKDETTAEDTKQAARRFAAEGAEIILFTGGDGTARDILDAVGADIPVIGVPAGCKIYSGVYAVKPEKAGRLALDFLDGKVRLIEAEVLDIDEESFRRGDPIFSLYGSLRVPHDSNLRQNLKIVKPADEDVTVQGLSRELASGLERDTLYLVGSGSTTSVLMEVLGQKNTLLGVDALYNGEVIANDLSEDDILALLDEYASVKLIVTVIGGQGYLFGRGNQQLSARVLRRIGKENITVIAARSKMEAIKTHRLYVDTGDETVNRGLLGPYKVWVGPNEHMVFTAES